MAITYPLTTPATPGFKRVVIKALSTSALSASPFTRQQQVYEHQGEIWLAECTLPPMARATAESWKAFLLSLRGRSGTFVLGDPSGKTPRGVATGNPTIRGAGQLGKSLNTRQWTANTNGILLAGDYIQIAKNYLTFPGDFTNSAWIKTLGSITATNISDPDAGTVAQRFTANAGATDARVSQASLVPPVVSGRAFQFAIWLKAASGAPSLRIGIRNQAAAFVNSAPITLSTSWQRFPIYGTMGSTDTSAEAMLYQITDASAIDLWGPQFYSTEQDARLHSVLNSANSDGSGLATLDLWPRLRESTVDWSPIIISSAKALFRLASDEIHWDVDEAINFGFGFSAIEAI